jgi:hypothetical protein
MMPPTLAAIAKRIFRVRRRSEKKKGEKRVRKRSEKKEE